jgi:hypothetical protein
MKSSSLTLALIECLLGMAALHIPAFIGKISHIEIPDALCIAFSIFVFCATVLGEVFSLYYTFAYWDVFLHFSSGIMLGMFGSILLLNFLEKKKCETLISPMFVALVAVGFALSIGVVWEFYEFSADNLLGLNMQKCLLQNGIPRVGEAALMDTMKDLMMDFLGGTTAAILAFRSLKHKKGWLFSYQSGKTVPAKPNMQVVNGLKNPH